MPQHPLTWKQYADGIYRELRRTTGASADDCRACLDAHEPNWRRGVQRFAEDGGVFTPRFLNTLDPIYGRYLASFGDCVPRGYVWRDCR